MAFILCSAGTGVAEISPVAVADVWSLKQPLIELFFYEVQKENRRSCPSNDPVGGFLCSSHFLVPLRK